MTMYDNEFSANTFEATYSGSYLHFVTKEALPSRGTLTYGTKHINFWKVDDGYAVAHSTLLGSGMSAYSHIVFVPETINQIPVTELHCTLPDDCPGYECCFALKRCYVEIQPKSIRLEPGENYPFFQIYFDGSRTPVEFCYIHSIFPIRIEIPKATHVRIDAPKVSIAEEVPDCVTDISCTGHVYPANEPSYDTYFPNTDCFAGRTNLKSVDGSLGGKSGWSFSGCTLLESVHLSEGIEMIPGYAFKNCSSLKDLYIPDTVKTIGEYAFAGCTALETIHLPNAISKFEDGLFKDCRSLKKCFIPDSVKEIGAEVFAGCASLRKPWIPNGIEHIDETAFDNPEWRHF